MEPFLAFKFLHIAFMFAGVAATTVPEVVLHAVAASREPRTIATFAGVAERFGNATPIFFVAGAIFGLVAAWTGSMNFTAPWLLASYALFVLAMVVGFRFTDPWVGRLQAAALATDGAASTQLSAVIDDRTAKIASGLLLLIDVVLIALMVFKPTI